MRHANKAKRLFKAKRNVSFVDAGDTDSCFMSALGVAGFVLLDSPDMHFSAPHLNNSLNFKADKQK